MDNILASVPKSQQINKSKPTSVSFQEPMSKSIQENSLLDSLFSTQPSTSNPGTTNQLNGGISTKRQIRPASANIFGSG